MCFADHRSGVPVSCGGQEGGEGRARQGNQSCVWGPIKPATLLCTHSWLCGGVLCCMTDPGILVLEAGCILTPSHCCKIRCILLLTAHFAPFCLPSPGTNKKPSHEHTPSRASTCTCVCTCVCRGGGFVCWRRNNREFGKGVKFVVAKKADSLYKTVSAASIVAKVSQPPPASVISMPPFCLWHSYMPHTHVLVRFLPPADDDLT